MKKPAIVEGKLAGCIAFPEIAAAAILSGGAEALALLCQAWMVALG